MNDPVQTRSGFTYAEIPLTLTWEGIRLNVAEVLTQARIPEGLRFHVRTTGDRFFTLTYGEMNDEWQIEPR